MTENGSSKAKILEAARERFKLAAEVDQKQREREKAALRFQVPEMQWTDEEKAARRGDGNSPPRPILSVSKLDQPISLVVNQMRNADLGVEVHPVSEDADTDNAEIRQGLYRYIERDSHAEVARAWAFDRAVKAGRGAYRILTEYDAEGGDPSDQKIVIRRILQQEGVFFDPAANEADYSDGEFCFVLSWMPEHEYKRRWPKSKGAKADRMAWESMRSEAPEWVRDKDVLVGEYWYKVHETEEFEVYDEKRQRDVVSVKCATLTGWEILEEYDWPGKFLPIVPVIGKELQPFDAERRFVGVIEPAMGAQKFFNFAITSLVERMALEPRAPWVANAETIEGYEQVWQQSNIKNFPVLPYNHVVKDGAALPPPQRAVIDQTGMSISLMAAQQADSLIQASTAVFDPSLGRVPQNERSGKAILALQSQADAGTSHFIQNLSDISMTYEAKVIMDLMPKIYDRAERTIRIIRGDDKKVEPVVINAPSMNDPRTGRPVPVPAGAQKPQQAKEYRMTEGTYGVSVTIGKSFQTRLQEGSERMGEILGQRPDLFVAMGDLWLQFQDFPGAKEMSKRMAKWREQAMPGLGEGEDGQKTPEAMEAEVKSLQQQAQQMQQQLQQAMQALQTEQAKQQAQILKAQLDAQTTVQKAMVDNETKMRISAADNETKLALAGLEAKVGALLELLNLEHERAAVEQSQRHEMAKMVVGEAAPEAPEPTKVQTE